MAQNKENQFLTLDEDSIDSIINSETFTNVRLKMLAGEEPKECENCFARERSGNISKRQYEQKDTNLTYKKAQNLTDNNGRIDANFEFIELRLGNTCNLRCLTCNPNSSYLLQKEFETIRSKAGFDFVTDYSWVTKGTYEWVENKSFWDELELKSKDLKKIYINGGEPTLIKAHYKYLEYLIESETSKNIELIYSINMTNIPEKCFNIWKQFKKVRIEASIDGINEQNTYLRFPSKWDKLIIGLEELRLHRIHFQILQTVSVLNFYDLDQFYTFFKQNYPNVHVVHNFVFSPEYYSPLVLPKNVRNDILDKLAKTLPSYLMNDLNGFYRDKPDNDRFSQFKSVLNEFDELRKSSFSDIFREYSSFLKIVDKDF
jgi:sulfatase maturation enzyme AslB (radical SAM superfamily)